MVTVCLFLFCFFQADRVCCVWLKDFGTVWKASVCLSRYNMSECVHVLAVVNSVWMYEFTSVKVVCVFQLVSLYVVDLCIE